jgi:hypothetical protein
VQCFGETDDAVAVWLFPPIWASADDKMKCADQNAHWNGIVGCYLGQF